MVIFYDVSQIKENPNSNGARVDNCGFLC
jgi:hypothetical protein